MMRLLLRFTPTTEREFNVDRYITVERPAADPVLLVGVTRIQRISNRYVITCPSGPYIYMTDQIDYMEIEHDGAA